MKYTKILAMLLVLAGCVTTAVASPDGGAAAPIKVACMGNSITYGHGLENPDTESYPAQLQQMLDEHYPGMYEVGRFAKTGASLQRKGAIPYFDEPAFRQAMDFAPDIAVIGLGINDTDPIGWPYNQDEFIFDYLSLIDSLRSVNSDVRVIMVNCPPLCATHKRFKASSREWRLQIRDKIKSVAAITGAPLIDFEPLLINRQHLMPDGLHPNKEGATLLARSVYSALTGDYEGLSLSPIFGSGMVVQRNRPLILSGVANAGNNVTVSIGSIEASAIANPQGEWELEIDELPVGGPYVIVITDGSSTIEYDDVWVGDVWLVSGDSSELNYYREEPNKKVHATGAPIRCYAMTPCVELSDSVWSEQEMQEVNALRFFQTPHWADVDSSSIPFQVTQLAETLCDSIRIPIGIIYNAVTGSPIEAWIDNSMLQEEMPELLMPAVAPYFTKPSVTHTISSHQAGRQCCTHPYAPSYLFATAIQPLDRFAIKGGIWLQGDANDRFIEVYESLFPLLVDSWRNYWKEEIPLFYTQLGSGESGSWPIFRDVQRRLESCRPALSMVTSIDKGSDLVDGLLLELLSQALGYDRVSTGPQPIKAYIENRELVVVFNISDGMYFDGNQNLFEVAEYDGLYYPAKAEIKGNTIVLHCGMIGKPHFVRYNWYPEIKGWLLNSAGRPASTFKMHVTDDSQSSIK